MRQATRYDKDEIKTLLRAFRDEAQFDELAQVEDSEYLDQMLDMILVGGGVVFLEEGKGLLMAIIQPSIWDRQLLTMHELAWYVLPEYRRGSVGFRLFDAYVKHGEKLKADGRIRYFTMSKLDTSPTLKYERYGFRKKDENWIH